MSVVCVAKYTSVEEALVARSKLDFYGIPAWFVEEHAARCKWVYLQGASYCHIEVPASFEDDARFLLNDQNPIVDYDPCVDDTLSQRQFAIGLVLIVSIGYLGIPLLLDCLYHWYKKIKSRHRPQ